MSLLGISLEEVFEQKWKTHQKLGKAQAIWRLPQTNVFHLVQSEKAGEKISIKDFDQKGEGFLTASFDGDVYFIKADHYVSGEIPFQEKAPFNNLITVSDEGKNHFIQWVDKSVSAIKEDKFQKVVLSRTDECQLDHLDLHHAFLNLSNTYPNAFVAAFFLPTLGAVWLCASPEILVEQQANGIFKTVSLAGTQTALDPQGFPLSPQHALWTQKEIEEQAFVSRYIIECFKRIRLREYIENGPRTVLAGNLMHLKSEFIVDTQALGIVNLTSTMLEMLHPTSAVCGTPKEEAKAWISNAEMHQREMYAGFLGPVGFNKEVHIYVNLRTVKITQEKVIFFAGCGITEDSIAEKEWEETTMKCRTLKGVLMSS